MTGYINVTVPNCCAECVYLNDMDECLIDVHEVFETIDDATELTEAERSRRCPKCPIHISGDASNR